jgi:hypothetical protein
MITQEQMKQLANANKYVFTYLTTTGTNESMKWWPLMFCPETFDTWINLSEDYAKQVLIEIVTDEIGDETYGGWLDEVLDNIPLLVAKEITRREEYRKKKEVIQ